MTSKLTVEIAKTFTHTATREQGIEARQQLLTLLEQHSTLILDFSHVQTSASFIDECIGVLAQTLGKTKFNDQIVFKNATSELEALVSHVVARRLSSN